MVVFSEKRVFLDISVDEKPIGRVEIRLFVDDAPKTCENFRALCTGEVGMAPNNKARLHYKGNEIHRVVKKFMIQGGDITEGDGRGGYSIYGRYFDDEKFKLKHTKPYLLSMANKGANSNSSQFFITTAPAPHCNGKHVVFGEVIRGQEVVDLIDNLDVDDKSKPIAKVLIFNCGELVKKQKPTKTEEETTALDMKKKADQNYTNSEYPKPWLYRDYKESKTKVFGKQKHRSRSNSRSRNQESRHGYKKDNREKHEYRKKLIDDNGIVLRGRGGVRYRRERSTTPDHWKRNAPKKWVHYCEMRSKNMA